MVTTGRSGKPTVARWLPGSQMPRPRRATRRTPRPPSKPVNPCHGPIVLLFTLKDPDAFVASTIANEAKANSLAAGWPYAGYRMTVLSTGEEQPLEGPYGLGGNVRFYA